MTDRTRLSDEELVTRAQLAPSGDARDFEVLVGRHASRVLANCRYLSRSAPDAEDLAQEVFVKAFFALPRFEGRSQFRTWLQRIKINHCLNFLKSRDGRQFLDIEDSAVEVHDELQQAPTAEATVVAGDERARITAILDGMSNTLRVPLILRDADGLAYEEIAETLGIGLSAVKMRIKRAREEFRGRYGSRDLPGGSMPPERSHEVASGAEPARRTRAAGGRG